MKEVESILLTDGKLPVVLKGIVVFEKYVEPDCYLLSERPDVDVTTDAEITVL